MAFNSKRDNWSCSKVTTQNNLDANGIQQEKWNTDHDTTPLTTLSVILFWNKHQEWRQEPFVKRNYI
jgi:hypothetical protein